MSIDLVIPPWVRISGGRFDWLSNTASFPSTFTGAIRTVDRLGDRVSVSFSTQNASHDETLPTRAVLSALRASMRGQTARIWYTDSGYTPRGSFPVGSMINGDFSNGTTGWSSNDTGDTTISVTDMTLRLLRVGNDGSASVVLGPTTTGVQYAPYVARTLMRLGRGSANWSLRIRDASDSSTNYANSGTLTEAGYKIVSGVPYDTDLRIAVTDNASGKLAGDYMELVWASLSRCALFDNGPNLLLQSDEFDTTWTATRASVDDQTSGTDDPIATATADSIIEDSTAASTHYVEQTGVAVSSATGDYSFAVALKAGSRTFGSISLIEASGSTELGADFDLTNGTAGTTRAGANWASVRSFIKPLGEGWHYCCVVGRKTNAATSLTARIWIAEADNDRTFSGNGTGNIYAWRATLAQSSVPTRLIQTTTTAQAATSQTGPGYYTKGWPPSTSGLLLASDWVQVGSQLNQVVAPVNSDAAGMAYLQLAYPLRNAPSDNDPVIIDQPMGSFVSVNNEGGYDFNPEGSNHEFQLVEHLAA